MDIDNEIISMRKKQDLRRKLHRIPEPVLRKLHSLY